MAGKPDCGAGRATMAASNRTGAVAKWMSDDGRRMSASSGLTKQPPRQWNGSWLPDPTPLSLSEPVSAYCCSSALRFSKPPSRRCIRPLRTRLSPPSQRPIRREGRHQERVISSPVSPEKVLMIARSTSMRTLPQRSHSMRRNHDGKALRGSFSASTATAGARCRRCASASQLPRLARLEPQSLDRSRLHQPLGKFDRQRERICRQHYRDCCLPIGRCDDPHGDHRITQSIKSRRHAYQRVRRPLAASGVWLAPGMFTVAGVAAIPGAVTLPAGRPRVPSPVAADRAQPRPRRPLLPPFLPAAHGLRGGSGPPGRTFLAKNASTPGRVALREVDALGRFAQQPLAVGHGHI